MKIIHSDNFPLVEDKKTAQLTAEGASGGATVTVSSIVGFAINQICLIGEIAAEDSEIIKTHAATAPSGTTITFAANLTFTHPIGTIVYKIDYDQIEVSHATTTTGSKTALSTFALQADQKTTQYIDSSKTAGFYFIRFKETIGNTYSGYSDPIPYGDWAANQVGSIIKRALNQVDEKTSTTLSQDWLQQRLWEARRELHNKRKRWSWRQSFNTDLGNITAGDYRIAMPTDMHKDDTNENIMGLRIGTGDNLEYITKSEMDTEWEGTARTTLASDYAVADGTCTITDSRDFDESGTIQFNDEEDLEYSANAESTGILTVSTAADSAHTAGVNVYQNANFNLPTKYTIHGGYIEFNCSIDADYADQNIWIDYYKTLTAYDSDGDTLDEPEYDMYVNYLVWCIKKKENPHLSPAQDADYQIWVLKVADLIKKEMLGQSIQFVPETYGE